MHTSSHHGRQTGPDSTQARSLPERQGWEASDRAGESRRRQIYRRAGETPEAEEEAEPWEAEPWSVG